MDEETEDWLKQMEFPLGGGINGLAAEEIQPIWTDDYADRSADPARDGGPGGRRAARPARRWPRHRCGRRPARSSGRSRFRIGTPRQIVPDELDLLQGLADQAAIALTNSNLYELLGESEGRYRHLVQNSPDLVWSIDAEAPIHVRLRHLRAAHRLATRGPPRQALRSARPRILAGRRRARLDRRPDRGVPGAPRPSEPPSP